jgi:hypothetical protein
MGASHDDGRPGETTTPSTDVSEDEAEAITEETSAGQTKDVGLVAPTTDATSSTAAADGPSDRTRDQHDDPANADEDRRQMQQGSGQASPSFGEQQQSVPPTR